MELALEIRNLVKTYPGFALKPVNLTVPAGQIVGLIGENGAGKTTILRCALHVTMPESGEVLLYGEDPEKKSAREKAAAVFEDSFFYPGFTIRQVEMILRGSCRTFDREEYQRLCRKMSLPENKKIKDLSRGMRMKLQIACALARKPQLLILDEATSGLDPVMRGEILDMLMEFIQDEEHAVLFSSHITSDLEKVADEIAYLHHGELLFQRNKDELLEHLAIAKGPQEILDALPDEIVLARKKNMFGNAALISDPEGIRHQFPTLVVDMASLDEMMQMMQQEKQEG